MIGDFGKWDYAPFIPERQLKLPRINIGDTGMSPLYQDHSAMQAYHFWAYVNYGYYWPKGFSKVANVIHERIEPAIYQKTNSIPSNWNSPIVKALKNASGKLSKTGSQEDYRLSAVGYNLGQALTKGNLTPYETYKLVDIMLRTDRYNVISEYNPWLNLIPKNNTQYLYSYSSCNIYSIWFCFIIIILNYFELDIVIQWIISP